jgi:hypothetical protein
VTDKQPVEKTTDEECGNGRAGAQDDESQPKQACPDYLGPWPVALGENAPNYESLLSTICAYYKPSDPIEWIHVRDFTDSEWQKQRMRRTIAICIDLAIVDAVERILQSRRDQYFLEFEEGAEGEESEAEGSEGDESEGEGHEEEEEDHLPMRISPRELAQAYVSGRGQVYELVLRILKEEGIAEEKLTFAAAALRAPDIERMERSATLHQACRDEAVRNLERHRANKRPALVKSLVEDAEYRVIEDKSEGQKEAA